jgi:hypothetical protein
MNPVVQSALFRALRTFIQTFVATYLLGLASIPADDGSLHNLLDLPLIEKALFAAVVAALSFIHRLLDPAPIPTPPDPVPEAGVRQP